MRLFFLSLLVGLAGVASAETVIKIATLYPPGSQGVKTLQAIGERIRTETEGEVNLKVYPGGVMGDDNTVMRKMRIGQLSGAMVSGTALDLITPDLKDISLPFQFDTLAEVYQARETKDAVFRQRLNDKKWSSYGPVDGGFSYLMSTEPMTSLDDIRAAKLWLPNTKEIQTMSKTMNVNFLVMNIGDVLTGLDTGAINTLVAPPSAALTLNWHSRFTHYTTRPVIYTWGMLILPERALRKVSKDHRVMVNTALNDWAADLDDTMRKANQDATAAIDQLLTAQPFSDADVALLRETQAKL